MTFTVADAVAVLKHQQNVLKGKKYLVAKTKHEITVNVALDRQIKAFDFAIECVEATGFLYIEKFNQ